MRIKVRADSINVQHTWCTLFVNGKNCGQLCIGTPDYDAFKENVGTQRERLKELWPDLEIEFEDPFDQPHASLGDDDASIERLSDKWR